MAAAYGLYTHIQSNRRRSILLLIGLFFLVYVMVFAGALAAEAMSYDASLQWLVQRAWIDAVKAAPFATIGAALWIFLAYRFNQSLVDMVTAGVISFFAEMFFRMFFYARWSGGRSSNDSDRGRGGGGIAIVIAIALIALAWFLSVVIRFALSRKREYLADAGSVELTKNPDAMISALRKIENRGDLEGATSGVMEMCIDNPRSGFENLFDTHPPVDKRVDALVRYAGGHDPGPLAVPQYDDAPALGDQSDG